MADENTVGILPPVDSSIQFPPCVRDMRTLKRTLFNVKMNVCAARCPAKSCTVMLKQFKHALLKRARLQSVVADTTDSTKRLVLLKPDARQSILQQTINQETSKLLEEHSAQLIDHQVDLSYEHFSTSEILRAILPEDYEVAGAFETIGHIAHLNLRKHLMEYKHVIGQVILDKNAHIRTVVNKTDSIDETFRFFKMEVLAGDDEMKATVKEHGCTFELDFSKVYWNSRLQSEHKQIVDIVGKGSIVFDVFAGIGPFAIPIAKKSKCKVYANDLNPESHKWLKHNAKLNKLDVGSIETFNLDGREFIENVCLPKIQELYKICDNNPATAAITTCVTSISSSNADNSTSPNAGNSQAQNVSQDNANLSEAPSPPHLTPSTQPIVQPIHFVMNLPAIAETFLDVFNKHSSELLLRRDITVHCYCFSKAKEAEIDAMERAREVLGSSFHGDMSCRVVRRVAPNKVMLCVTFNLLYQQDSKEPQSRKRSISDDGETHYQNKKMTTDKGDEEC